MRIYETPGKFVWQVPALALPLLRNGRLKEMGVEIREIKKKIDDLFKKMADIDGYASGEFLTSLAEHWPAISSELDRLYAGIDEWICPECRLVHPKMSPGNLFHIPCMQCNGSTMPRSLFERLELRRERDELQKELKKAREDAARWKLNWEAADRLFSVKVSELNQLREEMAEAGKNNGEH